MPSPRLVAIAIVFLVASAWSPAAEAAPRNPYAGFNLSGVNYGAQQWERAQREGRSVWPYYDTPSRRSSGVWVAGGTGGGTGAGAIVTAGGSRTNPRPFRRWRR